MKKTAKEDIALTQAQRETLLQRRDPGEGFLALKQRDGSVQFVEFYVSFRGEVLERWTELPVVLEFDEVVSIDAPDRPRRARLMTEEREGDDA